MGQRVITAYRTIAFLLLNTLLFFLVLELAAGAVISIASSPTVKALIADVTGTPNDLNRHYLALPYYEAEEWSEAYWREHELALSQTYTPYVVWRNPPYSGEMINIDQNGVRQTPGTDCGPASYEIFVFGGSAMWGWGAPDWGTIPAYLQDELQSAYEKSICIVNYAENAHVSTQGLIQLQLLLQAGEEPDLVIFYDGVNEVLAASQTGEPILHQNYSQIASLFNNPQPPLAKWLQSLRTFRLPYLVVQQLSSPAFASDEATLTIDSEQLGQTVADAYLNNYKTVEGLAAVYDFDYYFFWQPHIVVGGKALSPAEQNIVTGLNWVLNMDQTLKELFTATYERIRNQAKDADNLHYLAHAFDGEEAQIWIDTWGHVTPEGNRLVAQMMAEIIKAESLIEN
jgi:lysophospholipase L1-like esterase